MRLHVTVLVYDSISIFHVMRDYWDSIVRS